MHSYHVVMYQCLHVHPSCLFAYLQFANQEGVFAAEHAALAAVQDHAGDRR